MIPVPSFDRVYVISDLHMGGPPGHRIFGQEDLLSRFIDHLRDNVEGKSALVINGDMVDFLAQSGATYFDPAGAIEKLDDICRNFPKVWQSLAEYVGTERRHLIVTLGNHDLELALPWVREHLLRKLATGNGGARERITLSFEGAGFACAVGARQVLCLHGNEVDNWNVTDYEKLRRIAAGFVQGRPVESWTPNAGSKLVIDVMNDIKSQHAFIDLLKPEKQGAVRILFAMHPELKPKLAAVAGVAGRWVWDKTRRALNLLSEEALPAPLAAEEALDRIVAGETAKIDMDQLMDEVEKNFKDGRDPLDLVYETQNARLGIWSSLVTAISGGEPWKVAWQSVRELANDSTFAIYNTDADYEMIDALAGSNFDVVVAGHTHLARSLTRRKIGRGWYFNSGTWAWLMRLEEHQLTNADAFKPVFDRLEAAKTIEDLGKEFTFARPTVVIVENGKDPALRQVTTLHDGSIGFIEPE
jgi:UDP-2,3-diacylglucosamine pyrophosphatase LpxH